MSYYYSPPVLLRHIRNVYGGYNEEIPAQQKTEDAPPAPLKQKRKIKKSMKSAC